jgi:hypothetical protein
MEKLWQERIEEKLDSLLERVSKLELKVQLKYMLLSSLAGFLAALATMLLHGCAYPKPGTVYLNEDIKAQYESAAAVDVQCIYPALPADADPKDVLLAPFWYVHSGGSAFGVGPMSAVTARHVVDCDRTLPSGLFQDGEPEEITLKLANGEMREFVVSEMGKDEDHDAAVIVAVGVQPFFKHWAKLARKLPAIDEQVCLVTLYPWKNHLCGPVTDYRDGDEWMGYGYMTYGLQSIPGNSGSAVYNSDGEVVAINVAGTETLGGGYLVTEWERMVPIYVDLGF